MFQTGKQSVPFDVVVDGILVGMPDAYGNRMPISNATIDLFTSDQTFVMISQKRTGLLAQAVTDQVGHFQLQSRNHPAIVPDNSLYFTVTEPRNGAITQRLGTQLTLGRPIFMPGQKRFDLDKLQVNWSAKAPDLCSWNSRPFRYPADFAATLKAGMGQPGSIELIRSDPDPALDQILATFESESLAGDTGLVEDYAKKIQSILKFDPSKIHSARDLFKLTLQRSADIRFNSVTIKGFRGAELATAAGSIFGTGLPGFLGFEGRVAFCTTVFAANAVLAGQGVRVTSAQRVNNFVTTVTVS